MDEEADPYKGALEVLRLLREMAYPRHIPRYSKRIVLTGKLAQHLEELHRSGRKEDIKRIVEEVVSDPTMVVYLTKEFWNGREALLNRGVGHFFKLIFEKAKKEPDLNSAIGNSSIISMLALLALAAHHDIPAIKNLDSRIIFLLERVRRKFKDPYKPLGRRSLVKLVQLSDVLMKHIDLLRLNNEATTDKEMIDILLKDFDKEEMEKLSKELGRNLSWPEYFLIKLSDKVNKLASLDLTSHGIHPEEERLVKPYLVLYDKEISPELKKSSGEEFYRQKFGEHYTFVLKLKEELEKVNRKKRKYRFEIPDNYIKHVHAQVGIPACTAWDTFFTDLLHGPFIPVVLKTEDNRTVGRIFLGLAKDDIEDKYYVFYGDYEGKESGRHHFKRDFFPLLEKVTKEHFGTKPVNYKHTTARLLIPVRLANNPWI